jgi:hypothetical protein
MLPQRNHRGERKNDDQRKNTSGNNERSNNERNSSTQDDRNRTDNTRVVRMDPNRLNDLYERSSL